jgi:hypothetical protein
MFEKLFIKDYGHSLLSFLDSYHKASGHYSPTRARLHTAQARHKRLVTDITSQPKLLRGRDLQHLGLNPGPHYRAVLNKLRDAQLDGLVSDREEALHYVRNLLATKTL